MLSISFRNPVIESDMVEIDSFIDGYSSFKDKNILVSGASGMIASYLVAYFIWLNEVKNANIQIFAIIRNKHKAELRFGDFLNKTYFHLVNMDITYPLNFDFSIDYVIHAASLASPQSYGIYPVETILPNVVGTNNLLSFCKDKKIDKFLFFSSGAVYGSISNVEKIEESTMGTMDFLLPGNCYGESKRCGESLCKAYFREYGIPTAIARIHHTYGPTAEIENDKRVFSEFVNSIINDKDIIIRGDGLAKRAFCYLTDAVISLLIILLNGENGEVYNIGNPNEYISIGQLAKVLVDLFPEKEIKIIKEIKGDECARSPEKKEAPLSIDKIIELGYSPKVNVSNGFLKTINALIYERE